MKYKDGKLVEAKNSELIKMYKEPYTRVYRTFSEFKLACMMSGCDVIEDSDIKNIN